MLNMRSLDAVLILLVLCGGSLAAYRRTVTYNGEIVVKCNHMDNFLPSRNLTGSDVWSTNPVTREMVIRVKKDVFERAKAGLAHCVVVVSDLEEHMKNLERREQPLAEKQMQSQPRQRTWFEEYHDFVSIVNWYRNLEQSNSGAVRFVPNIGKSSKGNATPAVHIGNKNAPKIYLQCLIHAREWISGAICMYIAEYLTENRHLQNISALLHSVEFVIVPVVNPDGYEYTWNGDRLWRKNRREIPSLIPGWPCVGVDLNRNFDVHWAGPSSPTFNCDYQEYSGPSAASEPETQNVMNYFRSIGPVIGAIDFHSYGQYILRPYGFTKQDASDNSRMKEISDEMSNIIMSYHDRKSFTTMRSSDIYPNQLVYGTATDWFYEAHTSNDVRAASYTIELRSTLYDPVGFDLPPEQIIPSGQELVPAIIYFAEQLVNSPLPPVHYVINIPPH